MHPACTLKFCITALTKGTHRYPVLNGQRHASCEGLRLEHLQEAGANNCFVALTRPHLQFAARLHFARLSGSCCMTWTMLVAGAHRRPQPLCAGHVGFEGDVPLGHGERALHPAWNAAASAATSTREGHCVAKKISKKTLRPPVLTEALLTIVADKEAHRRQTTRSTAALEERFL